ncbi:MAG: glycosyltransferase, partial [Acidobacteriota bacterium]
MPPGQVPYFSVIIPSRLRHDRLAALLRSLVKCSYPQDRFEVIVIDEASGSPPRAVLAPFSGHLTLAMIELGIGGLARARNAGSKHAHGDFLAFIDEDCTPTSDWLNALGTRAATAPGAAIVGRTVNALPTKLTSEATQALLDFHSIHYRRDATHAEIFSASNLAIPANAFRELGGFDESMELAHASEVEFCHRWVKSGRQVNFLEEAVVLDAHTPSIRSYFREH